MNVINLHFSWTMILFGILASTTMFGLTSSASLSTYEKRDLSADQPKLFLLMDQNVPEFENEVTDLDDDPEQKMTRVRRVISLSIVNPVDTIRNRILLEYQRRQAQKNLPQIENNRKILDYVGKRTISKYEPNVGRTATNSRDYARGVKRHSASRDLSATSNRVPGRMQNWLEENDPILRELQDDRMPRMQANDLRLL